MGTPPPWVPLFVNPVCVSEYKCVLSYITELNMYDALIVGTSVYNCEYVWESLSVTILFVCMCKLTVHTRTACNIKITCLCQCVSDATLWLGLIFH